MADKEKATTSLGQTISNDIGVVHEDVHLQRGFGIWAIISIAWNMVNIFGGMSYIFVVGFSAGGIPTIFYGLYDQSAPLPFILSPFAPQVYGRKANARWWRRLI